MKKLIVTTLLIIFIISPVKVFANITCNDGTISPSCSDCHQGCCSHHGGCSREKNYYNEDDEYLDYYENNEYDDSEDNSLLYLLGIVGAITGGYYIGKKRRDK